MFDQLICLYVEDDRLSREIMQMILGTAYKVQQLTLFENSENFLERVHALPQKPNVFLLDIHVPPHSGFEMLSMLRADPTFADSTIIALTASVMNEEVAQLQRSGFNGAIAKPLSIQTFPELLKRILEGDTVWHIA